MRLNAQTDYALRIMMVLATKQPETATIQEIATRLGLSQTHLMRIAAKLASCGLVRSHRGRRGGLTVGRDAKTITVEQVVKAIEPDFALVECLRSEPSDCSVGHACRLEGVLSAALGAFMAELRCATLADLTVPNRAFLIGAFGLQAQSEPS